MKTVLLASLLFLGLADVAPGCVPGSCRADRSGTPAVLAEDTFVHRDPGDDSTDIRLPKGSAVRTQEARGAWVFIHCERDEGGGTVFTQGWIPISALRR